MGSKGSKDRPKDPKDSEQKPDGPNPEDDKSNPQWEKFMQVVEDGDVEGMKELMGKVSTWRNGQGLSIQPTKQCLFVSDCSRPTIHFHSSHFFSDPANW